MIVTYPNNKLNKISSNFKFSKKKLFFIKSILSNFLDDDFALGISCIQIGIERRIFAIKNNGCIRYFINPIIIWKSLEKYSLFEGCLSIPNFYVTKYRSKYIKIKALDLNYKFCFFFFKKEVSSCTQHEFDHLNGKLINN